MSLAYGTTEQMSSNDQRLTPPDGIGDEHARPIAGWRRHASPLSLVVFGMVIALAFTGVLGHERDWRAEANGVALQVHAPETIRNGEFSEMRVSVTSEEPIAELVIGVDQELWEDTTVNTMIPAAADEQSGDGEFRFAFAALEPGTQFLLKADLQVNPDIIAVLEGQPRVIIRDGELLESNLRRNRLTRSEIESEMRLAGIGRMEDVAWGILETRGKISFIQHADGGGEKPPPQPKNADDDGAA